MKPAEAIAAIAMLAAKIALAGVMLSAMPGCAAVEAYRIWTAEPSDGYAIGAAREIPKPYRNEQ